MKLFSWNTAKRLKKLPKQAEFINNYHPDIVALQEVIPSTEAAFRKLLKHKYPFIISSFQLADDLSLLQNKRMFGQLIASKFEMEALNPKLFNLPWPERVLSVSVNLGEAKCDVHTTHIPPGSSNGWTKIEMINGIIDFFAIRHDNFQILCGDFNTPQKEDKENGFITFGQRIKSNQNAVVRDKFSGGLGRDWDAAERSLFERLNCLGLEDMFRKLHPNDFNAYSWQFKRKDKVFKTRFDHIFADKRLEFINCMYLNNQGDLSDHSPILGKFSIPKLKSPHAS